MKKFLSLLVLALLLAAPGTAIAQETIDPCVQAQLDAEREVDTPLWFAAGCLFGIFGIGAAYLLEPSPSAMGLVGKSADYVAVYTECYQSKGRSEQTSKAFVGCLTGTALQAAVVMVYYVLMNFFIVY